jgi:hypothetical protein
MDRGSRASGRGPERVVVERGGEFWALETEHWVRTAQRWAGGARRALPSQSRCRRRPAQVDVIGKGVAARYRSRDPALWVVSPDGWDREQLAFHAHVLARLLEEGAD